ncbi:site-2 protease family protein [Frankia sp. CNm7]|uniref:Zinc metalloprotease n=1 Tax=Frankia nepalensis TaxID=1836974 RepID=A0A937URW6_9ACTN|nr:site-2 protease family protein [Frankia nepalensis]MBL7499516.1 site-2 protease family protein [Frankia nepalensis]MBL7511726.1 site-2 protease family protein [Frankia nepalensis]MBL7518878.1 site-2 protease family protein [Frankia nepalensis]MBL7628231.1 site-2 protease family protein [Frankia nepalensis]
MADQPDATGPNSPARPTPGIQIGRVRGVPILLSPLAIIFAILVASLASPLHRDHLPTASDSHIMLLSVISGVGFVLSLVLHELGHALTALGAKLRVRAVTVHGFAGFTEIEPEPPTPAREFFVAFSGPFVNGLLTGACFLGLQGTTTHTSVGTVLFYLGWANLLLFVFNLAPGLPLDGGRVVVAAVWRVTRSRIKGLRAGAYCGFFVAAGVAAWGLRSSTSTFNAVYLLALAGFIGFGAYQSLRAVELREKLPDLRAGRLIRKTLPVEGGVPLAEALRRAQQEGATAVAVIDRDGNPSMIMNGASVDALPEHRRPWVQVAEVSRTVEPHMILDADLAGEALLGHVQRHPAPEYLVTQQGRPVGVLTMVDLVARFDRDAAFRMAARR